jgi:hypothetical protein
VSVAAIDEHLGLIKDSIVVVYGLVILCTAVDVVLSVIIV